MSIEQEYKHLAENARLEEKYLTYMHRYTRAVGLLLSVQNTNYEYIFTFMRGERPIDYTIAVSVQHIRFPAKELHFKEEIQCAVLGVIRFELANVPEPAVVRKTTGYYSTPRKFYDNR